MNIDHILLTRFNLPSGGTEAKIRASEGWLTHRWELFEQYCAPSVESQSDQSVQWIIYFDPESPQWLKEAIAPYEARQVFTAIYRTEVPRDALIGDLRRVAVHRDGMLLTTNLDNDDGLAVDFAERLRSAVTFTERRAIYIIDGLIKGPSGIYVRRDPHNAFCSVAEPWNEPRTCWADWHILLNRSMPVVEIDGPPGWLQVIHGENVSNRVRGRLTSPAQWAKSFPGLLSGVDEPDTTDLLRDRIVDAPMRSARDVARSVARRVAIAVLGKEGLQRAKTRLNR